MADNIFGGLAKGIRGGVAQTQQQRQLQQVDDDRTFNRLVNVFSLIPKTDVASRQSILDQISEQSDGQIPKLNIEQGTTVMGILAPSLKEHAEGKITKDEVLSRIGVLGLQQPTKAAELEKFATGFEERGTAQELAQARAIEGLPEEQFVAGEGERAIEELRGMSEEGREILAGERKPETLAGMKANILERLSDEDQEKFLLKPSVQINLPKPASAGERTAIAGTRASIGALDNLKTLFDESFTGPFAGRKGAILNIFGANPAKQEAFIAATAAFRNQVIKDITGAQMSEPEAKRILKQVPNETDADSVWLAKYEQSIRNLKFLNEKRIEVLEQSGVRAPVGDGEDLSGLSNEELLKRIGQ